MRVNVSICLLLKINVKHTFLSTHVIVEGLSLGERRVVASNMKLEDYVTPKQSKRIIVAWVLPAESQVQVAACSCLCVVILMSASCLSHSSRS